METRVPAVLDRSSFAAVPPARHRRRAGKQRALAEAASVPETSSRTARKRGLGLLLLLLVAPPALLGQCEVPTPPPPVSLPGDTVWVDDEIPQGATPGGNWQWTAAQKASGYQSHTEPARAGVYSRYFTGAPSGQLLAINGGDKLVVYVLLNPCDPPEAIMFQWNDGSWEHRAYWGPNVFPWGTDGTASRRPMGALPAAGVWTRLEVPASAVGLEGRALNGISFVVHSGQVWFDRTGKISAAAASNLPPSATLTAPTDGATFTAPASVTLSGSASDSDGTINAIEFFANGEYVGEDLTSPYSITWTPLYSRAYTLTARARDNLGATTTSSSVSVTVTGARVGPRAVFLRTDSTTQGSWKTVYGADGQLIVNDSANYPAYARVSRSGGWANLSAASTTDVRALQKASGADRIASMWVSDTQFTIDLNLTDGKPHAVAFYCLDWDTHLRAQRMDVLDGETGELLDSQDLPASFNAGKYLIWELRGFVRVRVTRTGAYHCLVSGLFFDPVSGLSALRLAPASVVGGGSSTGTVTLAAPAPEGGAVVSLSSSPPGVAEVPASVTVERGETSATFDVTTSAGGSGNSATVLASYGEIARTAVLTVRRPPPVGELTEGNASAWVSFASDGAETSLADDSTRVRAGTRSLKFVTASGFDTGVRFPGAGDAHWDLSGKNFLTFWAYAENSNPFQGNQPVIVLKTATGDIRYTPPWPFMFPNAWRLYQVALHGDSYWVRTITGSPDLSAFLQLEIHHDTWGAGFTVYYDGLEFVETVPAELTEGHAIAWSSFPAGSSVSDDSTRVKVGAQSLRFVTASSSATGIRFPAGFSVNMDLTGRDHLTFWAYAVNDNPGGFEGAQPVVLLKSPGPGPGNFFRYSPSGILMSNNSWRLYQVPLAGGGGWTRTSLGSPTLTNIFQIEIQQDTTGAGFTVYYDGLTFGDVVPGTLPEAQLTAVKLLPTVLPPDNVGRGKVVLTAPAPPGGAVVALENSHPSLVTIPDTVTVPEGLTVETFTVTPIAPGTPITISAIYRGVRRSDALAITQPVELDQVMIRPPTVVGGASATGWALLSNIRIAGSRIVALVSSNPAVVSVPENVTITPFWLGASFSITTAAVEAATSVTISATSEGVTKTAVLTVTPTAVVSSLHLSPSSVETYGTWVGTVMLNGPAPAGGATIALSSGSGVVQVPPSLTVPQGLPSAAFMVRGPFQPLFIAQDVAISATYAGETASASLNVTRDPATSSVAFLQSSVIGGRILSGFVFLNGRLPLSAAVSLSSSNPEIASVPTSVLIPDRGDRGVFGVSTGAVELPGTAIVAASFGALTRTAEIMVTRSPVLYSLTSDSASLVGGASGTGRVTLNGPAQTGGEEVVLASSNTTVIAVPESVTVPLNTTLATFLITSYSVAVPTTVTISASCGGQTRTLDFIVTPGPAVSTVEIVSGPAARITLNGAAPPEGAVVTLASSEQEVVAVPASVTVFGSSAEVALAAVPVDSDRAVLIFASYGGLTQWAVLGVFRPTVRSFEVSRENVIVGDTFTGTVTLSGPAPAGGLTVPLAKYAPFVGANVPAGVTVAADETSATFSVTTYSTTRNCNNYVDITAQTRRGIDTVRRRIRVIDLQVNSLTISPSIIIGGTAARGTVVFNGAPEVAVPVFISSSNPSVASVPAEIMVDSVQTVEFTVSTVEVEADVNVTISASRGSTGASAPLRVLYGPSPFGPVFSSDPDDQPHTAVGIDSISPYNGQLAVTVPIGPVYSVGPGLDFQLRLQYSSRVWGPGRWALWGSPPYTPEPFMVLQGDPALGLGWSLSLGKIVEAAAGIPAAYIAGDGSAHRLYNRRFHGGTPDGFYYTRDGTYLRVRYVNATAGYQMWSAGGNLTTFGNHVTGLDDRPATYENDYGRGRNGWHATRIENPYGDGIDITYQTSAPWVPHRITIPSIGGSGNRVLTVTMSGGRVSGFSVPTFGGTTSGYLLYYAQFGPLQRPIPHPSTNPIPSFLTRIDMPGNYSHSFTYSTTSDTPYARGAMRSQTIPTGATITYDYGTWTFYHANILNRPGIGECEFPPPPFTGRPVLVTGPGVEPALGGLPISDCRAPDRAAGVVRRTVGFNNAATKYYQYNFPNGESGTALGAQTQTLVVPPPDEEGRQHSTTYLFSASTGAGVTGPLVGALQRVAVFSGDSSIVCPGVRCDTANALRVQRFTYSSDPFDSDPGSADSVEANRRRASAVTIYNPIAADQPPTGKYHQVDYQFDAIAGRYRKETHSGNLGGDVRETETVWTPLIESARWKLDLPQTLHLRATPGGDNFSTVTNTFDPKGFPTSTTVADGSGYGTLRHSTVRDGRGFPSSESFTHGASTYTRSLSFVAGSLATTQWSTMLWKAEDNDIDSTTGLVRTARDPSGLATSYQHDALSRPVAITPPSGGAYTTITYDSPTETTTRLWQGSSEFAWSRTITDPLGRPVKVQRKMPGGALSKKLFRYDRQGNTVFESEWVSDAVSDSLAPGTSWSDFDDFGRPRRIAKADGKTTTISYSDTSDYPNSVWRTEVTIGDLGGSPSTTRYLSDAFGNTIRVIEPTNDETTYTYNPQDRLTQVTQGTQTRTSTYDAFGFLRRESFPEKEDRVVEYLTYDAFGNVLLERQPGVLDIGRRFDAAGRLTELTVGGQRYLENQYDGQVSCVENPNGCPNGGTYKLGKLTRQVGYNPAATPPLTVFQDFFYRDRLGLLSSKETRVKNGSTHIIPPVTESWTYDSAGQVTQYSHPRSSGSFTETTAYQYGLPVSVNAGGVPVVTGAAYHPSGMLASYTAANNVVTSIAQDASSRIPRPSRISTSGASANLDTGPYSYDGIGNVRAMGPDVFNYDRLSRLTSTTLDGLGTQGFNYDRYGNLLGVTGTNPRSYSISTATNRISGATYDWRGNLLLMSPESYTYDGLDRMVRYQAPDSVDWKYLYEGSGDRLIKIPASGAPSDYLWTWRDGEGRIATEWVGSTICQDNVYLGSLLVGSLSSCEPIGWTYYSSDHLGTPRLITDPEGTTLDLIKYWPYGEEASASPTTPQRLRFAGMEKDEGSRYHAHMRSYDFQTAGRFLSVDLLGGSPADPQSWNRYSYVLGNPINLVDPFGLAPDRFDLALVYDCRLTGECASSDPVLYPFAGSSGYFSDGVFVPTGSLASEGFGQVLGSAEDASSGGFAHRVLDTVLSALGTPLFTFLEGAINDDPLKMASGAGQQLLFGAPLPVPGLSISRVAGALSKRIPKQITVIGSHADTMVARNWPGHNVLNLPRPDWSMKKNIKWLDSAIRRGDDIYLATDPAKWLKIHPDSKFFPELRYLEWRGFKRVSNFMVR